VYIYPDGGRYAGTFDHCRPLDGEFVADNGVAYTVSYKGDKCLWEGAEAVSRTEQIPTPIPAARLDVCAGMRSVKRDLMHSQKRPNT